MIAYAVVVPVAIDPSGSIVVTGNVDRIVRASSVTGEALHLLLGHVGDVEDVAVSPDVLWLALAGVDRTLCLWPMPGATDDAPARSTRPTS